jgi:dihydroorotase
VNDVFPETTHGAPTPTVLRGGTILDPSQGLPRQGDLVLVGGWVSGDAPPGEARVIDCAGKYVCPGFVDLHANLREPGDEAAETIESAGRAAVAGGFTSICCLPDTDPPLDNEGQIEFVIRQAQRAGRAKVWPMGGLTVGLAGEQLAELASMHARGAVAFGDAPVCRASAATLRRAMTYATLFDGLVSLLPEEPTLGGGAMHAGTVATRLGLSGTPVEAETLALAHHLLLAAATGCRYHARGVTTSEGVALLRRFKGRGHANISCDVTPAHLLLTDEACADFDPLARLRPPLRPEADRAALVAALADGTIDALATGHAPQRPEAKDAPFPDAADGAVMLEHALPLSVRALIDPGHLDWLRLIELLSTRPAQILRLKHGRGTLQPGSAADVTVVDPAAPHTLATTHSRSHNTPFTGLPVNARVAQTFVAGRLVYRATGRTSAA